MNLNSIREARSAHVGEMRALLAKAETEKRSLSDDESTKFEDLKAKVSDLEQQEARAQFLADQERTMAGRAVAGSGDNNFDTECRKFSLCKAIAARMGADVDDGREREVSQEIARRTGRQFDGIAVPMEIFEERVLTTAAPVGGPGSNIISTDHRGDLFIDRLRAALRIRGLGATVLSNLRGNVDIPKLKQSATAGWVAENSALTPSDHQFSKVQMTPKHCGALTEFSRNMLLQSSPDIEQLVRADFAAVLAEAIDGAAIAGGGGDEPTGITGTSNILTGSLATPSWGEVLAIIEEIETADNMGSAWLTHPSVVRLLRSTLKESGDAGAGYIMESANQLAGYPLASSTQVPRVAGSPDTASAIFGNWSDLLVGYWSAFDLLVNPYESTAYSKGNVQVRAMLTADVAVRHPESFVVADDAQVGA
jgi:HK97 family phage major capsid protein